MLDMINRKVVIVVIIIVPVPAVTGWDRRANARAVYAIAIICVATVIATVIADLWITED